MRKVTFVTALCSPVRVCQNRVAQESYNAKWSIYTAVDTLHEQSGVEPWSRPCVLLPISQKLKF